MLKKITPRWLTSYRFLKKEISFIKVGRFSFYNFTVFYFAFHSPFMVFLKQYIEMMYCRIDTNFCNRVIEQKTY